MHKDAAEWTHSRINYVFVVVFSLSSLSLPPTSLVLCAEVQKLFTVAMHSFSLSLSGVLLSAAAVIKIPVLRTQSYQSFFWGGSEYNSFTCFACCQEFCFSNFCFLCHPPLPVYAKVMWKINELNMEFHKQELTRAESGIDRDKYFWSAIRWLQWLLCIVERAAVVRSRAAVVRSPG